MSNRSRTRADVIEEFDRADEIDHLPHVGDVIEQRIYRETGASVVAIESRIKIEERLASDTTRPIKQ